MTDKEFITKIQNVLNYNTVYMWGVFGAPVTEKTISDKSAQYPEWYTPAKISEFKSLVGKNYFGFDCVNLIKGILWGWDGNNLKTYGGSQYGSNGVPDVSANGLIAKCIEVSTNFADIIPGEVVWIDGHVGLYIGNGFVVECTTDWNNNVQMSACKNLGNTKTINKIRTWTKHGKLPYITYATATAIKKEEDEMVGTMKVGGGSKGVTEIPSILKDDTNYAGVRALIDEINARLGLGIKISYDAGTKVVTFTK